MLYGQGHQIDGSGTSNKIGVKVNGSINVTVRNFTVINWYTGIHVDDEDAKVIGITSTSNNYGFYLEEVTNVTFTNNLVSNSSDYGVYLENSVNNLFFNNIFNNTANYAIGSDSGTKWNTTNSTGPNIVEGPFMGGNAWLKPDGEGFSQQCNDSDFDGFCDQSYSLGDSNVDNLPLSLIYEGPPATVSNLTASFYNTPTGKNVSIDNGKLYINWTWDNPVDFDHAVVYINGDFQSRTSREYYNLSIALDSGSHTISIKTVDSSGNVNSTWVNHTVEAPQVSEGSKTTFDNVTKEGTTEVTSLSTNPIGTSPPGYKFKGEFVNVNTSAEYEGTITVCLDFDNMTGNIEAGDKLFHWDGDTWNDVTTSVNVSNNTICGQVSHLSPFGAGSLTESDEEDSEPVGGQRLPISRVDLLMPYIIFSALMITAGIGVGTLRKRKS